MRRRSQRGAVMLETLMYSPILLALLVGTIELGRVTYTYVALQKALYGLARYVGTQQGVNFCDDADPTVTAAKNLAITGTLDASAEPLIQGLTADMIQIRAERYSAANAELGDCGCSAAGCDASQGGLPPDYIVVNLLNGYPIRPVFFGLSVDPILLRPHVRVPFGGL